MVLFYTFGHLKRRFFSIKDKMTSLKSSFYPLVDIEVSKINL